MQQHVHTSTGYMPSRSLQVCTQLATLIGLSVLSAPAPPTLTDASMRPNAGCTLHMQTPPTNFRRPVDLGNGVYVCGDHRDSATLDGAIKSGRRAADALVAVRGK